jgi:5'-3' exoribonuclease 1
MVKLDNDSKVNIGIPMKFESKGLKVLGYTKRNDRGWEYSETAARALERYRAAFPEAFNNLGAGGEGAYLLCSAGLVKLTNPGFVRSAELCPTAEDPDKVIKDMKKWLVQEGLSDLDAVSLFAEKLEQETVGKIEAIADRFASQKTHDSIKRAAINGIPRQAVMKPSHAVHRLIGQEFRLGDRVVMAQDSASGGVPLGMKGVVVGISSKDIDIIWDRPFMGGETLGGRCVCSSLSWKDRAVG